MNDPVEQLGSIDDEAIPLDAAALPLAALDHPDVDLAAYVDLPTAATERPAMAGDGTARPKPGPPRSPRSPAPSGASYIRRTVVHRKPTGRS